MSHQQTLFDVNPSRLNSVEDTAGVGDNEAQAALPAARPPKAGPTVSKRHSDCMTILRQLRNFQSVSSLRLRELLPCSVTQRISDLRKDGYVIECYQPTGNAFGIYTLKNSNHRGKKYGG